jgi:hypothetical protein
MRAAWRFWLAGFVLYVRVAAVVTAGKGGASRVDVKATWSVGGHGMHGDLLLLLLSFTFDPSPFSSLSNAVRVPTSIDRFSHTHARYSRSTNRQ